MSKGKREGVLRNREESLGGQREGSLLSLLHLFPHHSISLSSLKTLTPDSSTHLVASLHLKDRWKASAQLGR